MTTSEVKAHAEFSASGSERWLSCPGSITLSKQAPAVPESKYAAEGTEAHACLEFLLKNFGRCSSAKVKKATYKKYDEDMVDHALAAVDWISKELFESSDAILVSDIKVDASPFTCEGQFGTLDVAIVREFGRLTVIDYKYGAGHVVDPVNEDGTLNSQLAYYALGLSYEYHHNFSEVELVIIQPRAYHESGETIRSVVVPIQTLLDMVPIFKKGVERCQTETTIYNSGSWCKWCPAATICPEIKNKAAEQARIVFGEAGALISAPEPKEIILPHLSEALDACDKLEAWIDKVRDHATHLLGRGHDIPGFKLVEKRSPRKWNDPEKAAEEAEWTFGDGAFSRKLLSPAQLEKAIKGSDIETWVAARTNNKSSGTTLVRESDKRPAVKSIQEIFKVVE